MTSFLAQTTLKHPKSYQELFKSYELSCSVIFAQNRRSEYRQSEQYRV